MTTQIGPYPLDRIVLCSADAGPGAQRDTAARAEHLFPNTPWIVAPKAVAEDLNCRFVILTRAYGVVDADDIIWPYDLDLYGYHRNRDLMQSIWRTMIPRKLSSEQCHIVVFYTGGVRDDDYVPVLKSILNDLGIDLFKFGRPQIWDIGNIRPVVELLMRGTSRDEIRDILNAPGWSDFSPAPHRN